MSVYTGDFSTLDLAGVFRDLGLYLSGTGDSDKHYVTCPWESNHGKKTTKTDTFVAFYDGEPIFNCSHNSCADRHTNVARDWAESIQPGIIDKYCREKFRSEHGSVSRPPQAPTRTAVKPAVKALEQSGKTVSLPKPIDVTPARFLEMIHDPEDFVCLTWKDEEGALRVDSFQYVGDWSDIYEGQPGPFSSPEGVYHCINALKGPARTDEQVADYQYCLLEGDAPKGSSPEQIEESKRKQYAFFMECGLPIAAVYDSAGKSTHALVRISAGKDAKLFRERVDKVYEFAAKLPGLDSKNKNPARLSRLPGAYRGDKLQALLHWGVGAKSYKAWESSLAPAAASDSEPEITQEQLDRTYKDTDQEAFPATMAEAAFNGPLGKLVDAIAPNTEACREALLCQAIVAFGNILGRTAWINAGSKHFCSEYLVLVGDTSKGRKGTGLAMIQNAFEHLDSSWSMNCQLSGIQSGEGIINSVRDEKWGPSKKKDSAQELVLLESGINDKRKLIVEEEFAQILAVSGRKDNTTSNILRSAWDCPKFLENSAKREGQRATKPHISLIAHTTREEFRVKSEGTTDAVNGTFNRFLFCASRRSQILPEPKWMEWGEENGPALLKPLQEAIARFSGGELKINRDQESKERWRHFYKGLDVLTGNGGMIDKVIGRLHAHAARLSMIFAVADNSETIRMEHQMAAEAVIDYCARSAKWIFGVLTGDKTADKVIRFLRRNPKGATKSAVSIKVFFGKTPAALIDETLAKVKKSGFGDYRIEKTDGRSAEVWFAK